MKRILVVDDNAIIRDGMKALIQMTTQEYEIDMAESGYDAIAQSQKNKYHLILMDISMPGMTGIEAAKEILAKNSELKIIGVSMHTQKEDILGMKNAGAIGYLMKDTIADTLPDILINIENISAIDTLSLDLIKEDNFFYVKPTD